MTASSTTVTTTSSTTTTVAPGQCQGKADGTPCDDGSACTTADSCQGGTCVGSGIVVCDLTGPCELPGNCDPATGQCIHPPKPNDTPCDDGDACTLGDTCQNGTCAAGPPVVCQPDFFPTACHQLIRDCHPLTGQCILRRSADGSACDDGNACTTDDACEGGVCKAVPCPPGHACCSTSEPCADLANDAANCGACGKACASGRCLFGQCYDGCVIGGIGYAPGVRNPSNPCEICDPGLNAIAWSPLGTTYPAPPIYTCTVGCFTGFCSRGACTGLGATPTGGICGSASECSASHCNQIGVCETTPINEGQPCTPPLGTNACRSSTTGTCHEGQCVGAIANDGAYCNPPPPADTRCVSPDLGTCHDGACVASNRPDGTYCRPSGISDFHLQCNPGSCQSGQCQNQPISGAQCFNPDAPDQCVLWVCSYHPPATSTSACLINGAGGVIQRKSCPDACGSGDTCDPATGKCEGPTPSFGKTGCGEIVHGKDPSRCCPGQTCICPPGISGVSEFCFYYGCWNPGDVPTF